MSRYNLIFYTKKTKGSPELPAIYARITVDGRRSELSTGKTIPTSIWNSAAGKILGNSMQAKTVNAMLNSIQLRVFNCYNELLTQHSVITSEALKKKFLGIGETKMTIVQVFREHNDQMEKLIGKSFSKGTWERYETSLRHTIEFMQWKYKVSDMNVREINPSFVSNYEFWLRTERKCGNNSTVKYLKNFQKIINICIANDWISKNPFKNFKAKLTPVVPDFLKEADLEAIRNKKFKSERLAAVRDIFLFSCFTGLAYIDVKNLTRDKIVVGIDGERWIKINRTKTSIEAKIPILPIAGEIIDRYSNHPKCVNENTVLPVLSNQKMNEYLKEISAVCDLETDITFHTARHTFATTVTLNNGVPLETVSKMLGHTNVRMTQHYAKVLDRKISDDMAVLKNLLVTK